jgi:hypothetical protein
MGILDEDQFKSITIMYDEINTITLNVCRGGWQWFVGAILPAASTTPSLQIKGL